MKNYIMKNSVGLSILITALSIGYFFVIYLPQQNQNQLAIQKELQQKAIDQQEQVQKTIQAQNDKQKLDLKRCLDTAETTYSNLWDSYCAQCPNLNRVG